MTVASTISPSRTLTFSFSTVVEPSSPVSSMRRSPAFSITADLSLWRKSSASMWATFVLESADHAPIECGCERA